MTGAQALARALKARMPLEPPDPLTKFSPDAAESIYQQTAERILAAIDRRLGGSEPPADFGQQIMSEGGLPKHLK
jgi:hypothetical protein